MHADYSSNRATHITVRELCLQQKARMFMAPEKSPPTPIPATALPTMRAVLDGAVAHTSELEGVSSFNINLQ
jgi:hypothetical protein